MTGNTVHPTLLVSGSIVTGKTNIHLVPGQKSILSQNKHPSCPRTNIHHVPKLTFILSEAIPEQTAILSQDKHPSCPRTSSSPRTAILSSGQTSILSPNIHLVPGQTSILSQDKHLPILQKKTCTLHRAHTYFKFLGESKVAVCMHSFHVSWKLADGYLWVLLLLYRNIKHCMQLLINLQLIQRNNAHHNWPASILGYSFSCTQTQNTACSSSLIYSLFGGITHIITGQTAS